LPPKHKIKAKDIRAMSLEERLKLLKEMRMELITLRYKASVGTLTNPGRLRELRRNIARILTIIREEELRGAKGEAKQR
jgi:large subunit ribosomal protein L29